MNAATPAPQEVLDFWFGAPGSAAFGQPRSEWFVKDAGFDRQIAERFGAALEAALAGDLRDWDATAPGALARIVVLDQFTRNVFRDTARAFAGDALARAAARAVVDAGRDRELRPVQRAFVYLPFEHAEDAGLQDASVRLFAQLAREDPACAAMHDYALRHQAVIARFGRFPHRNAVLGRASTPDEIEFLRRPGSRF